MWNAYKDRNMILNVDGNNLGNPNVSGNIGYSHTLHVDTYDDIPWFAYGI